MNQYLERAEKIRTRVNQSVERRLADNPTQHNTPNAVVVMTLTQPKLAHLGAIVVLMDSIVGSLRLYDDLFKDETSGAEVSSICENALSQAVIDHPTLAVSFLKEYQTIRNEIVGK